MNDTVEREIDLLDLIWYVLGKWKLLILAGVIGLVLVGGYKFYSAEHSRKAAEAIKAEAAEEDAAEKDGLSVSDAEEEEVISKDVLEKEAALLKLQGQKSVAEAKKENVSRLQRNREQAMTKYSNLQDYMAASLLMNIDPNGAPEAKAVYQVRIEQNGTEKSFLENLSISGIISDALANVTGASEEASVTGKKENAGCVVVRDENDELLAAYGTPVSLAGTEASQMNYPEYLLDELVSLEADETANTVTVKAYGTDEAMAEKLLASACEVLEGRQEDMEDRYQAHELEKVSETSGKYVDQELAELQAKRSEELSSYYSQVQSVTEGLTEEELEAEVKSLEAQILEAKEALKKAEKDAEDAEAAEEAGRPSLKSSLKKGIKFGIIGGIVLAVLLAGCYFLVYVMDGKVHTDGDLSCYGLPLLAALSAPAPKKGCVLDKFFYSLRNKGAGTSNEVVLQTASVTIEKMLGDAKTVAVLSSLEEEALKPVTEALGKFIPGVQFVPVADSNTSVEAAEKLKAADAVIVFEKRELSRNREVEAELHQAGLLEKNIIGCIVA